MLQNENKKVLFTKTDIAEILKVSPHKLKLICRSLDIKEVEASRRKQLYNDSAVFTILKQIYNRKQDSEIDEMIANYANSPHNREQKAALIEA